MRRLTVVEINNRKPANSRLTAISVSSAPDGCGDKYGICKAICSCGKEVSVKGSCVARGITLSCGCYSIDVSRVNTPSVEEINKKIPDNSRWVATEKVIVVNSKGQSRTKIVFRCECGNERVLPFFPVISGSTLSCGCFRDEVASSRSKRYTHVIKELKGCYSAMIERCYNPTWKKYEDYGGRGVQVCDLWRKKYQYFLNWALLNGWEKGLQLDKDIKGDGMLYSPETCVFVTRKKNMANRRNSVKYEYNGRWLTLREILETEQFEGSKILTSLVSTAVRKGKKVRYMCTILVNEILSTESVNPKKT